MTENTRGVWYKAALGSKWGYEDGMNPADADAIAEYLREGGRVRRVDATVSVTEDELIAYLFSVGVATRYIEGDLKAYLCDGKKRCSLNGLERLANRFRMSNGLPPLAVKYSHKTISIRYKPES